MSKADIQLCAPTRTRIHAFLAHLDRLEVDKRRDVITNEVLRIEPQRPSITRKHTNGDMNND